MTRLELLQLVIARARANGFEFRRWYTTRLGLPWISAEASIRLLEQQRRYYALLFSHEFAGTFWKPGAQITFDVPAQSFDRVMPDGAIRTVERKAFIRRSARPDAWRYHLREMALADEPLRYLRKYLHIEDQLDPEPELAAEPKKKRTGESKSPSGTSASTASAGKKSGKLGRSGKMPRPLPLDPPSFLTRPYSGQR